MDSLCLAVKCRTRYDVLQQAQKWKKVLKNSQWRNREISLDEPELQPYRSDHRDHLKAIN